jgi:NAD(P)-dependent dehydrogenase (short-subunit alcohol dehydrogenase family)
MRTGLVEGKVALISGIGPGLGRAIALALAREGADVALGARRDVHLRSVAAEVEALGRRAVWRCTDVAREADCRALAQAACGELGGIDIVVNSAARFAGVRFADGEFDSWRAVLETCLLGALQLTYAALPSLRERGDGRVVNIGTMATRDFREREGPYAAAKSALLAATKSLARELGRDGIRVNAVNPGYIQGKPTQAYFARQAQESGGTAADYERQITGQTALGYIPGPEEIAGTVVFLASDLSRPVTGHVIECNGGFWM